MVQASAEKLEHTGPAEKERVASMPQREQLASMPEQHSHLTRSPDGKWGESQGEQELHLGERKVDQGGSMERKGWTPQ